MVLGGLRSDDKVASNQVFELKHKNRVWMLTTTMPITRCGHVCGVVRDGPGGKATRVVVAGGYERDAAPVGLSSVDILVLDGMTWTPGPPLPLPLVRAASVPVGNTFAVIGGSAGVVIHLGQRSKQVWRFDADADDWREMPAAMLGKAKWEAAAFKVRKDAFPKC